MRLRLISESSESYRTLRSIVGDEFSIEDLGGNIYIVSNGRQSNRPNILIAGCFHGDEESGTIGILDILESHPELINMVNASFIPLVSRTGFLKQRRTNDDGDNPNRGFVRGKNALSDEGRILKDHLSSILTMARDGFLTLHEDDRRDEFFIYSYDQDDVVVKKLLEAASKFFDIAKNSVIHTGLDDGSFEDLLHCKGISRAICTEIPGDASLDLRRNCVVEIIKTFIESVAREYEA